MEIVSDIPWGSIKERVSLLERSWYCPVGPINAEGYVSRKQHLERVVLTNGLRYAIIRNSETGAEEFDATEYAGLFDCNCGARRNFHCVTQAHVIPGTDLGDGFSLRMIIAGKGDGSVTPMSVSFVEKAVVVLETSSDAAHHELHYNIDAAGKNFAGRYQYRSGAESSTIWFKLLPSKYAEGQALRLSSGQASQRRLAYDICLLDGVVGNKASFIFTDGGQLAELQLTSKDLYGVPGALTTAGRGILFLRGDQLHANLANLTTRGWFGIETAAGLTIDRQATLDGFIANINSGFPKNPREVVKFVGRGSDPIA